MEPDELQDLCLRWYALRRQPPATSGLLSHEEERVVRDVCEEDVPYRQLDALDRLIMEQAGRKISQRHRELPPSMRG
jgi:hypothetical protein